MPYFNAKWFQKLEVNYIAYNFIQYLQQNKKQAFLFCINLLLLNKQVYFYIKRAKQPFIFFNLKILIELRASDATSKAIFYTIIKKKKATEKLFGVCQDLLQ